MVKVGGNVPGAILKKMEGLAKADDGQISAGEQEILNQLQGALGKLDGLGKQGTGAAGDPDGLPPGVMDKFRGLAKADDGKIDGTEQAVLNQLQSAFENIQSPRIKELISQVAQKMGLAGAQATARMASGLSADGPSGSPAASAGGSSDPLRCNSCGGGGGSDATRGASGSSGGSSLPALGGKGGMMFEDMLAQFLFDVIKEMQEELKKKMAEYKAMSKSGKGGGGGGAQGGGGGDSDSRQLLFEEIKNLMQKMQQMIQSLSNILNTLHNGAMNAIRNIR